MSDLRAAEGIAKKFGEKNKCDVFLYNGPILRGADHNFIQTIRSRKRRPSVLLVLTTSGGDAHAAYRMGRALQQMYGEVRIFVPGWCKSAGTLIAIAANEIIIGDLGELGPIDVQRLKSDDLWNSSSGLTEDSAISTLESASWAMFQRFVLEIKDLSEGQVTFKAAADAAAPMVAGLLSPIFGQIDPLKIGENSRAIKIASDYGLRLNLYSKNLNRPESMENLVSGYSSHGFVIDREEASVLFNRVSSPENDLEALCSALGEGAFVPLSEEKVSWSHYLNPEVTTKRQAKQGQKRNAADQAPTRSGRRRQRAEPQEDSAAAAEAAATGTDANVRPLRQSSNPRAG